MALIEVAIWEERDGIICFTPVPNSGQPIGHLVSGDADHPRAMRAIIDHYEREPQPLRRTRILLDQSVVRDLIGRQWERLRAMAS